MSITDSLIIDNRSFTAFPKIFAIGSNEIVDIWKGPVEITEKVDGSQIAWTLGSDNKLVIRSKGREIDKPDKLFRPAYEAIHAMKDLFPVGARFYGETLHGPHHNVLTYSRPPKNHVALFGASVNDVWQSHKDLSIYAETFEMDVVPILYEGVVNNFEDILALLERESFLGNEKIEGFVVKNFFQHPRSPYSTECFGKYVSEKFKEKHGTNVKEARKNLGLDGLVTQLTTEARWQKAVQHLRDDGRLQTAPADIGPLIQEVIKDIEEEESSYIKDRLYSIFKKPIMSGVTKGLPEWYKKELAKNVFTEVK